MRRLILAILLAGYAATFVRMPFLAARREFDPLEPRGRQVEQAIAERQFEVARPIAEQLAAAYPDAPVVSMWLADIYRGLGRPEDEARAWETCLRLLRQADEVCPALPQAYLRAGDSQRALDAFERCASATPDDPERLIDLADALAAAGRASDAANALSRAARLDASHPRLRGATNPTSGSPVAAP